MIKKSFKPRPFYVLPQYDGNVDLYYAFNKVQWGSQDYQAVLSLVEIFVFIFCKHKLSKIGPNMFKLVYSYPE